MTDAGEPEETPERNGGCAGVAVLTTAALGLGAAIYLMSRDLLIIAVWFIGFVLVYRAARKPVPGTANPTPPAPSERGSEEESQVTMVRDTAHPNRWAVTRPSPWLTYEHDNRDGT